MGKLARITPISYYVGLDVKISSTGLGLQMTLMWEFSASKRPRAGHNASHLTVLAIVTGLRILTPMAATRLRLCSTHIRIFCQGMECRVHDPATTVVFQLINNCYLQIGTTSNTKIKRKQKVLFMMFKLNKYNTIIRRNINELRYRNKPIF